MISPAGLVACGYADAAARWLLPRANAPQFPALPARTCPFARADDGGPPGALGVLSPALALPPCACANACAPAGGDGLNASSPSVPLNEWRGFGPVAALTLFFFWCCRQRRQ